MFLNSAWVDVTSDVRTEDGIAIRRGRANEAAATQPGQCSMTVDNTTGNYFPRNPLGTYFGSIGRNTPLRVGLGTVSQTDDPFTRTVSNGWGSTPDGHAWANTGTPYNVGSGIGNLVIPAANNTIENHISSVGNDFDATFVFAFPFASVLTAAAGIIVSGRNDGAYVVLQIGADQVMTMYSVNNAIPALVSPVSGLGLPKFIGQTFQIRCQMSGNSIRARAWVVGTPEPAYWHTSGNIAGTEANTGQFRIGTFTLAGNTNTYPLSVAFDNLQLTHSAVGVRRFTGEIASWPQTFDIGNDNKTVKVEAAGLLRRMGQGNAPLASAFSRFMTTQAPADYWSLEDGKQSDTFLNGVAGHAPMIPQPDTSVSPQRGVTAFAGDTDLPSTLQAPTCTNGASIVGTVAGFAGIDTTGFTMSWAQKGTLGAGYDNHWWMPTGSLRMLVFDTGLVEVYADSTTVLSVTPFAAAPDQYNDKWQHFVLSVRQSGSTIEMSLYVNGVNVGIASAGASTLRAIQRIELGTGPPIATSDKTSVSQVALFPGTYAGGTVGLPSVAQLYAAYRANDGELPRDRFTRLCYEENIPGIVTAAGSEWPKPMGPQRVATLLQLLTDCATVEQGVLYEPRDLIGVGLTNPKALYNTTARATIAASELYKPPIPTEDDQNTRNDVTAKRPEGNSARFQVTSGRLQVADPLAGGVGRYDTSVDANVTDDSWLLPIAQWIAALGTVDEARYPVVSVSHGSAAVLADATLLAALPLVDVECLLDVTGVGYDTVRSVVRGYTEYLENFVHTWDFNCSPGSPFSVIRLNSSATDRIDSGSSALTSSATTTATSLSVTTTLPGDLWITSFLPFDILVAGERMTVSAISGAASPQTFTVTRSVNGVVKAQAAGAAVKLFRPSLLAY